MKNIKTKQVSLSNWREEVQLEAKVDDVKYGKGNSEKKSKNNKADIHSLSWNKGVKTDRNNRRNRTDVVFHGHSKVERDRQQAHYKSRGVKKVKGAKVEEHVEGGIQVQNVADGLNFTEIETVDIIKTQPIKGASNWKLEMVTEMLISEGYNDEEIVTIISEELPKIPLGPILTGAARGAWNLSTKGVRSAYNLGKGARGIVNRGVRDTKLTGDIISTAKKLRKPDGISVTKNPRIDTSSKGGGLVKSFKGFMQNVKNAGSNLVNRTKGKLNRTDIKTNTPTTTKKPVEVLGGAATNTATKISKPMRNITPATERIKSVTDRVKVGAASGAGVVAGAAASKLNKGTFTQSKASGYVVDMDGYDPSDEQTPETIKKINDLTYKQMQRDKVDGPTQGKSDTIDGKKISITHSSVYGKEPQPKTEPTKRELRNKRNEYLSSPEGKRERRDARVKNKISGNRPTGKTKWVGKNTTWKDRYGNVIAPKLVDKKEKEVTNEGIVDTFKNLLKLGKNPKHKVSDETPMGKAVTGLQKRSEANKKAMELLNHYSWRDELNLQEMGAYQGGGTIINPSGSRNKFGLPDSLKPGSGPTKEVPLTPSQNRLLVKKKTKTTKVG